MSFGGIVWLYDFVVHFFGVVAMSVSLSSPLERRGYVHLHGMPSKGTILIVVGSPTVSTQTGWPVGFWAAELTHPLRVFQEAGYEVEIRSTAGGALEMDSYSHPLDPSGYSAHDVISLGYLQKESFRAMLASTQSIENVTSEPYKAIFLVGGQSPMFTFRGNTMLQRLFAEFYESGKPSAAVCHATTLLLEAVTSRGERIVAGKTWTGFADSEEQFADNFVGMKIQPYWIEEEARKLPNTTMKTAPAFTPYAIADGNLITGQQQNSGALVAELIVEQLAALS